MTTTSTQVFDGNQISSVQTQFFFEEEQLCYRITFIYGKNNSSIGMTFKKYDDYREAHESIIYAMSHREAFKPTLAA